HNYCRRTTAETICTSMMQVTSRKEMRFHWCCSASINWKTARLIPPCSSETDNEGMDSMNNATIAILLCIVLSVLPQHVPEKANQNPSAALEFLLGDWVSISQPGKATGSFSFTREVQGRVLTRRNHADYPAAKGRPASTHDDLMVIYQDGAPPT